MTLPLVKVVPVHVTASQLCEDHLSPLPFLTRAIKDSQHCGRPRDRRCGECFASLVHLILLQESRLD